MEIYAHTKATASLPVFLLYYQRPHCVLCVHHPVVYMCRACDCRPYVVPVVAGAASGGAMYNEQKIPTVRHKANPKARQLCVR